MLNTIFATKSGMTGKFTEKGARVAVTMLSVPQIKVKDVRTMEKHKYTGVRLSVSVPTNKKEIVREVRTEEEAEQGTEVKFEEMFKAGDLVNVSGISKGKGFTGVIKHYHFKGGPRTHGQSDRERAPGSSGSTTTPGRVYKGKRRSGHKGTEKIMVRNLKVFEVNPEKRILTVIGSVPGVKKYTLLRVTKQS